MVFEVYKLKVYEIDSDLDYMGVEPESHDLGIGYGTVQFESWELADFYINNPLLKETDFYSILPGVFGVSQKALDRMSLDLSASFKLMPISLEGKSDDHYLFYTTCIIEDCLDDERILKERSGAVTKWAFKSGFFTKPCFFRVGATRPLFCVTGFQDSKNDFFVAYHQAKMKGLEFYL